MRLNGDCTTRSACGKRFGGKILNKRGRLCFNLLVVFSICVFCIINA
jgi:hypothetical protein